MKKMLRIFMILTLAITLMLCFSSKVKAAEGDFIDIGDYTTTDTTTNTDTTNQNTNTNPTTNTNTTTETTTTKTKEELPKTGVIEDSIVIALIVLGDRKSVV